LAPPIFRILPDFPLLIRSLEESQPFYVDGFIVSLMRRVPIFSCVTVRPVFPRSGDGFFAQSTRGRTGDRVPSVTRSGRGKVCDRWVARTGQGIELETLVSFVKMTLRCMDKATY
jgi:hypothetical protein